MKLSSLQTELAKIERRRVLLQEQISTQAKSLYAALPGKVGLRTVDALIVALAPYASPAIRQKLHSAQPTTPKTKAAAASPAPKSSGKKATGRRTPRSAAQKTAVRNAFTEGKLSIREISAKHGVPANTLKKWKMAWGLTAKAPAKKK